MKLGASLAAIALAFAIGPGYAKPVALHFDVPAPCSREWAARGGGSAGANEFGEACLARSGTRKRLTREAVVDLALGALLADDRLSQLVPTDISDFCPHYSQLDVASRQAFWAGLLASIAQSESDYNPMAAYWEGKRDPEYSIGLLQISPSNKAAYGCNFGSEAELTDPKSNLQCAVNIMGKLVGHAQMIGGGSAVNGRSGAAAYWSTLRAVAYKPPAAAGNLSSDTRAGILSSLSNPGCR